MAPRLLLVEDADPVRDLFWRALGEPGFTVEAASTAAEALDRLADRSSYAAIVADCFLRDRLPLDWLAALRGAAPTTPMVIYSGSIRMDELENLTRDWRAVAVLEKPFAPARLVEAVQRAMGEQPDEARP